VNADPDLEWLLCVLPSLLGSVGSGHSGLVAALERGQAPGRGGGVPDSRRAEDTVERALPHLARARRLEDVWARLSAEHRRILEVHYRGTATRLPGVTAQLGRLDRVCLLLSPDRAALEGACRNPTEKSHAARIRRELVKAERAVNAAHRAWRDLKAEAVVSWVCEG
jgi:hypothetical protein